MTGYDATEQAYKRGYEQGVIDSVQHAHWIVKHNQGIYMRSRAYCSKCNEPSGIGGTIENQMKPYCPNCGAMMNEVVYENE